MAHKVLLNVPVPEELRKMLDEHCEVTIMSEGGPSPDQYASFDGLFGYSLFPIDEALMDRLSSLKVISIHGVGVEHIDLETARKRGIPVGNTANTLDGAAADMTFALILAIARQVVSSDRYARSEAFTRHDPNLFIGWDIHGSTLGIVGLGNIGRHVAHRSKGFDMRVLYHNRKPDPRVEAELGVTYATLNDLLSESDFVSLNVKMTEETKGLIGRDELAMMKPTAFLINVARGPIVDHEALTEALQNGQIRGAALDVTEPEPLPRDHPLLKMDNVIITPHLGSAAVQTRRAMARLAVDNLVAGLNGKDLPSPVV